MTSLLITIVSNLVFRAQTSALGTRIMLFQSLNSLKTKTATLWVKLFKQNVFILRLIYINLASQMPDGGGETKNTFST